MKSTMKSAFAFIAVALMIMVAVVPMVSVFTEENGVDAATADDTNVLKNVEVTVWDVDTKDKSKLIAYGTIAQVWGGLMPSNVTKLTPGDDTDSYYVYKKTGTFVRYGDVPGATETFLSHGPMMQISYQWSQADINAVSGNITMKLDGKDVTFNGAGDTSFAINRSSDGTATEKKIEGVQTVYLYDIGVPGSDYIKNVKTAATTSSVTSATCFGEYEVKLTATQGLEKSEIVKKVTYGTPTTVSGKISDANSNAIAGAAVAFSIDGVSKSSTTDKDGKYNIYIDAGAKVSITSITSTGYTFASATEGTVYDFGTVEKSVTKDFKAKEKTSTITVSDKDGVALSGISVEVAWYYQWKATSTATTFMTGMGAPTGVTAGELTKLSTITDVDGKFKVAYTEPTGSPTTTGVNSYANALVAYVSAASGPTYHFKGMVDATTQTKSFNEWYVGNTSIADAKGGSATLKSDSSTATLKVTSANGNPAANVTINVAWYYQHKAPAATTYTISTTAPAGITAGTVKTVSAVDKDGIVKVPYTVPTGSIDATIVGTEYSAALIVYASESAGYTVKTAVTVPTSGADSLATLISKNDAMADASSGVATVKMKENTYAISGNVLTKGVSVAYTNPISAGLTPVLSDKDGNYLFYILEGKGTVITPTISTPTIPTITFEPASFALPSVYENKKCDFVEATVPVADSTVNYKVTDILAGKVVFNYTVDGTSYSKIVDVTSNEAMLSIKAKQGADVKVSAEIKDATVRDFVSYDSLKFDGYKAVTEYTLTFNVVTKANGKVVSQDFDMKMGEKIKQTIKTDKDGIAKVTINGLSKLEVTTVSGSAIASAMQCTAPGTELIVPDTWATSSEYTFGYVLVDVTNIYVAPNALTTYTVNYYATDVNADASDANAYTAIIDKQTVKVDSSVKINAPEVNGYKFVGWMIDGKIVSTDAEYTISLSAEQNKVVNAIYEQCPVYEPKDDGVDSTTLIIGIAAVIIALIAVIYAVIQKKQ